MCRLYVRLPPSRPRRSALPTPFQPAFFSPLAAVRDSRRLLHPYREALSSVDFWEASGTGLSARQLEIGLERRRITGKLSSALLREPKLLFPPPFSSTPAPIFHFAFDRTTRRQLFDQSRAREEIFPPFFRSFFFLRTISLFIDRRLSIDRDFPEIVFANVRRWRWLHRVWRKRYYIPRLI